jgi:hypothetical protein
MPKFLAVYTMNPENLARFRRLTKAEQDAIDADGIPKWLAWETRNAGAIVHRGGMVGKTIRVTAEGIAPATNAVCGYLIVEAESAEAAAELFIGHPHMTVFPGDGVDIMPLVTELTD